MCERQVVCPRSVLALRLKDSREGEGLTEGYLQTGIRSAGGTGKRGEEGGTYRCEEVVCRVVVIHAQEDVLPDPPEERLQGESAFGRAGKGRRVRTRSMVDSAPRVRLHAPLR